MEQNTHPKETNMTNDQLSALINKSGWIHTQELIVEDKDPLWGWAFLRSQLGNIIIEYTEGWRLIGGDIIREDEQERYAPWEVYYGINTEQLTQELIDSLPVDFSKVDYSEILEAA